jgi:diguanylate cyclase (GGDEF)-like protein
VFKQAIEVADAGKYLVPQLRAEAYLGLLFAYKGDFEKAILNLNDAFSLMETQGRVLWLWAEMFSIASRIFYLNNDQEKAMEYARKANRFLLEMDNPLRLSRNLVDQGRILAKQGREDIALEFFDAASIWVKESQAPVQSAYVLLRKSEHLLLLNEIEKAEEGLVQVMLFGDEKQDTYLQIYSRLVLVDARLTRDDLDDVELILQQAERAVIDRPDIMDVYFPRFYLLKSRYFKETERYKEAYEVFQRYSTLRESAVSRQHARPAGQTKSQIAELNEKENRLLVREVALKSDEVEKEQKQKMMLGSLIGILLLVLGFVGYLLHKNIKLRHWLHELSSTDDLTKVANRRYIMEVMEFEVGRAHRYTTPMCAALLDIDHFKSINDTYGHHIGDEVLKRVAKLYQDNMRKMDMIGRYGGEEFVLVLPHTHISAAKQVLERLREMTEAQVFDSMLDRQVTVSIGLAELSDSEMVDDILKRADEVLYEAKRGGRNRIVMSLSARQVAKANH